MREVHEVGVPGRAEARFGGEIEVGEEIEIGHVVCVSIEELDVSAGV